MNFSVTGPVSLFQPSFKMQSLQSEQSKNNHYLTKYIPLFCKRSYMFRVFLEPSSGYSMTTTHSNLCNGSKRCRADVRLTLCWYFSQNCPYTVLIYDTVYSRLSWEMVGRGCTDNWKRRVTKHFCCYGISKFLYVNLQGFINVLLIEVTFKQKSC
jgi:hypothetical protein